MIPGLELVEELGRGAETVVYRARRDGEDYAVKVLRTSGDQLTATSFRREAARLASMNDPGLLRVHEVGDAAGTPYLIMDLIRGQSLRRVLLGGVLDEARVIRMAVEVASALAVAHRAGLVHRDVKPDNIMIRNDGQAQIVDFGLATRAGKHAGDVAAGTMLYSAPEQSGVLRRVVDARADLYGLGVVMFECLAGKPPFVAEDVGELLRMHLSAPPPDLTQRCPQLAPALAALVAKLLAKDPDDRYQSAEGLLGDLRRIAAGQRDGFVLDGDDVARGQDAPMVGRDGPATQLLTRWRRVGARRGGMAFVQGAPGIGKTRLVRELAAVVRSEDRLVLHGHSAPDDAMPLAPLRSAVEQHIESIAQLPPAEQAAPIERLRVAAGASAPLLRSLSPALMRVLAVDQVDAGNDERQFADAVAALLLGLADASGGMLLHLDDAQWWDEGTRRVMRQLVPLLADSALLVVATGRDDAASQPATQPVLDELDAAIDLWLTLEPLTDDVVESLVAGQLAGGVVPPELVARLAARCGGNPLAIHEYLRAVLDAGLLRPDWGTWHLDEVGLDDLALPDDLMDLMVHRVDGLGTSAQELLTMAAAVGSRFTPELVAAISGRDMPDVLAVLAEAAGQQLLESTAEGGFTFLHNRIREGLLERLDEDSRRAIHQRIADTLWEADNTDGEWTYAVARHYLAGELDRAPQRVFQAATAAGTQALGQHAAADAVSFLTQAAAIAQTAGIEPDGDFHTAFGIATGRIGQYARSVEHLTRALELTRETFPRARLYNQLAQTQHLRWDGDASIEMVRCGNAELGYSLRGNALVQILRTLAYFVAGIVVGRLPRRLPPVTGAVREKYELRVEMLSHGAQGAAMAGRPLLLISFNMISLYFSNRLGPGSAYALNHAGLAAVAQGVGWKRQGARLQARAVAAAALTGDPRMVARTEWINACAHDGVEPPGATTGERLRRVLDTHARGLDTGEYLTTFGLLGYLKIMRGYCGEVAKWYELGRRRADGSTEMLGNAFATIGAQAAALAGRPADAEAQLREVREFVASLPAGRGRLMQIWNLMIAEIQLAVEQGEVGDVLDRLLDELAGLKIRPVELYPYQRVAWVYQAFGRLAALRAAPEQSRAKRLADARAAVRALGKVAKGPALRAYHLTAVASLRHLQGDHRGALEALARVEHRYGGLDLPLLGYEVARVRARAWRSLGCEADARRWAAVGLLLANEYGWQSRARWIGSEFDIETDHRRSARSTATELTESVNSPYRRGLKALHEVSLAASTVLDQAQLSCVALDEIVRIFGAQRAFVWLAGETGQLVPYLGRDENGADIDNITGYASTLVQQVHVKGEALVVTGSEEGAALGSESAVVHGLRSIMVAPLAVKGRRLGVVYLDSRAAKGIFTREDVDILVAITNQIAASFETARAAQLQVAVHAAERARDTAESLRAAMNDLAGSLDPTDVSDRLAARITSTLNDSTILLVNLAADGNVSVRVTGGAEPSGTADSPAIVPVDPTLAALLDTTGAVRGCRAEQQPPLPMLTPSGTNAWLAVPLRARGDFRSLVIAVTDGRPYTDTEVEVVSALAEQAATALDNALLFRKVEDLAIRDGLTGLFNRRHFFEIGEHHIDLCMRNQRPFAAMMLDIDHFKKVNDTYGHATGDDVIREVAHRLAAVVRQTDLVCRYGGEEFAVLLPEASSADVQTIAARLLKTITDTPIPTGSGDLPVTVSVGYTDCRTWDGDLQSLINLADEALYEAKRTGRNRAVGPADRAP